ncbi:hypothetical protein [Ornithinimicrobium avium]|nr:hypothetical protein [Ornithinimicrobium avium]
MLLLELEICYPLVEVGPVRDKSGTLGLESGTLRLELGDRCSVLPSSGPQQVGLDRASVRELVHHAVADPVREPAAGISRSRLRWSHPGERADGHRGSSNLTGHARGA